MGTIILIVSAILIALIVIIGVVYKARLRKQYQEQPYQSVTGTDLEVDLKLPPAQKAYRQRITRVNLLMLAGCAAVVVIGGGSYAAVNWWHKTESQRIAQAEQKNIDSPENKEETEFQQWKAKRIAEAQKEVDETWKKYQEIVNARILLDSIYILRQQREQLLEQIDTYKDEFYKLSSKPGNIESSAAAEKYRLTMEDFTHRQTELERSLKQYRKKRDKIFSGFSYYKDAVNYTYNAFVEASEQLTEAKALTQEDKDQERAEMCYFLLMIIVVVGCLGILLGK